MSLEGRAHYLTKTVVDAKTEFPTEYGTSCGVGVTDASAVLHWTKTPNTGSCSSYPA